MTGIAMVVDHEQSITVGVPDLFHGGPEIRLRMFDQIEPGFGVVPILANEPFVFRAGEVAVYKEERPTELIPGLYCLERQQSFANSPRPDSPRIFDRKVVYVRVSARGVEPDNWEYLELDTKVIAGVRRHRSPEGPLYLWALDMMLLGPVVGIYAPGQVRTD